MRYRYLLTTVCLALSLLTAPRARADALADEEAELDLAKSRFQSGQYEDAVSRFEQLLGRAIPPNDPKRAQREALRREARPHYIVALVGLGRVDRADEIILEHLRDNPFYDLPPGQFPTAVQDRFIEVRRLHHEALEARKQEILRDRQLDVEKLETIRKLKEARLIELERLAAEERIVERRSRLVAALPFGVGQFQNGSTGLGVLFLSAEVALLGGHVVTGAVFQSDVQDFLRECTGPLPREQVDPDGPADCEASQTQLQALRIANWTTLGAAFATMIAGIIEAQVSFEPETSVTRKRAIPPRIDEPPITIEPTGGATDSGFYLGVRGRF